MYVLMLQACVRLHVRFNAASLCAFSSQYMRILSLYFYWQMQPVNLANWAYFGLSISVL